MKVPAPDPDVLARRAEVVDGLRQIVSPDFVIADPVRLKAFASDALTLVSTHPLAAVLPGSHEEVAEVLRFCNRVGVNIVPRGAGTGLSGGATPLADGVLLGLSRLNRILEVDLDNRCVRAEAGVTNLALTRAVEDKGFYYAPDPSSQIACTIGGNVAENSGGVHCLKYGLTTNNLLGVTMVLMNGETIRLGGKHLDSEGYDLLGLVTGSEGMLGVVTEVTVRVLRAPEARRAALMVFATMEAAGEAVAAIIGAGIIPAGLEMMDGPAIRAVEAYCHPGYPKGAEALLLVELDGAAAEVEALILKVAGLCKRAGAREVRVSESEEERLAFWKGRKAAFPAVGRIAPDYICMDGTIPRRALPKVLREMSALSRKFGLGIVNVFHAGDGNLHPLILFDGAKDDDVARAEALGAAILTACVKAGGVLSGEHGIGLEKRDLMGLMFTEDDLNQQQRVKCAFDPGHKLNPGKVFPTLHACVELGRMHIHRGRLPFPTLPRL